MKKRIELSINTSETGMAKVGIDINGKKFEKVSESKVMKSQIVLPLVEEILNEHNLQISDITEITVATGPGSFTGLRVGVAVANALATLLGVRINGKKTLVTPTY